MKRRLRIIVMSQLLIFLSAVWANAQEITISGKVTAMDNSFLPGVTITVVGTTRGVITDNDGSYTIVAKPDDKLVFSFIGMDTQIISVNNQKILNVQMKEKTEEMDEVTVVAFAKQKKESVLASITTVDVGDLKIPSSNLTTALAGRMSGLISYQRSGEPGQDDASFFVRGVTSFSYASSPLILIDGVEMSSSDLARIQPDDIASFSIMKDATATALYGARGANGVIMVTTREGKEGKAQISFRYETSFSSPTRDIDMADAITYMKLNNEAIVTRDPANGVELYSMEKIEKTASGANPNVYPATNWYKALFKEVTINHRANFNVNGGGKVARYYIAGTFNQDNGALNVDSKNNFNNNIDLKRYLLRSNVNINITNTTEAVVRLHGTFDDYTGPIDGGSALYSKVMRTDPVLFPAYYEADEQYKYTSHILFGNSGTGNYINPYADMVKGYKEYSKSVMLAQFEVKQKLDFVAKGLFFRGLFSTNRYSYFDVSRYYNPFYYSIGLYDKYTDKYSLACLNPTGGTEYLEYNQGDKTVNTTTYLEGTLNYSTTIAEKHDVSGLLVSTMRNYLTGNAETLQLSLPQRNLGISGRFTYSYDKRYFTEFNFGYNGSERFAKKERFGFFPSAGVAWFASNEPFWKNNLQKVITKLKLKATYGLVGNDAIGSSADRFFYLSEVNLNNSSKGFTFGEDFAYTVNGVSISRYENDKISWETARKMNLGMELGLFDDLEIQADYYTEYRTNILMSRQYIPASMGLQATPQSNVGEASSRGLDVSLDYQHNFKNGTWLAARANFTYAKSKYEVYEDLDNTTTPWLSKIGKPISQQWGYVAERLFVDDTEVANSPTQTFGDYMGGDIKYKDINGDDQITSLDKVPIGYPTEPEIVYGFGFSTGYKNFDLSCFFQGLAREAFWINSTTTAPFVDTDGSSTIISKNALLNVYADNHWSEKNRDVHALWPRLSDHLIENNTVTSTWFMRDGSFLRLKSLEFGFSIPKKKVEDIGIKQLRIYFSGTNLFVLSKFKLWDPEMAGEGLGYPIQKVYNVGLQVSF
ncbi:MAG: TonB-dependent receptor [Prolixibacteraceae bacterium]